MFRKKQEPIKLLTYRVITRSLDKRGMLKSLFEDVLEKDKNWHFFLDGGGITLRITPNFENKVKEWLHKSNVDFDKRKDYLPEKDEYQEIKFIGQDWLPLFHELSIISLKYPPHVIRNDILERLTHSLINQSGLHDFNEEALIYSRLGLNRAHLSGRHQGGDYE